MKVVPLIVLLTAGCAWSNPSARLAEESALRGAELASLDLATVGAALSPSVVGLPNGFQGWRVDTPTAALPRVGIGRDAVSFDDLAQWSHATPSEIREARQFGHQPWTNAQLVLFEDGTSSLKDGLRLSSLEVLARSRQLVRRHHEAHVERARVPTMVDEDAVEVFVEKEVPYGVLAKAVFALGQVGFGTFLLPVKSPTGLRHLSLRTLGTCVVDPYLGNRCTNAVFRST